LRFLASSCRPCERWFFIDKLEEEINQVHLNFKLKPNFIILQLIRNTPAVDVKHSSATYPKPTGRKLSHLNLRHWTASFSSSFCPHSTRRTCRRWCKMSRSTWSQEEWSSLEIMVVTILRS
jgi:hypothetical protein